MFTNTATMNRPYNNERVYEMARHKGAAQASAGAVAMAEVGHGRHNRPEIEFMMLRLLSQSPSLSQRQIASRLNVSLGCANYCLRALVDRGLVKCSNFYEAEDKRRYLYLLTPSGISGKVALTGSFLARKMQEHAKLSAEIEALKCEVVESDATPSKVEPWAGGAHP
jgi:EPS-associated MarR family transcriptional regulator